MTEVRALAWVDGTAQYREAGFQPTGETEPLRPGSSATSAALRLDL